MGLAPYGEPRFADVIRQHLVAIEPDGSYRLHMGWFDFLHGDSTISERFGSLFGAPARDPKAPLTQLHMDVARSIQAVCEEVVLLQARHARQLTGMNRLCMAGGVALNSVANGKLVASGIFDDVWIQPAAGDAGGSVGAALVAWHHVLGRARTIDPGDGMSGAYLGTSVTEAQITEALAETGLVSERLPEDQLVDRVAGLLAGGAVVGWVHGRMEFGPRALGARSILGDPRATDMQKTLNLKVKFRESFRPFAPAILAEEVGNWFEHTGPSPYMLMVADVIDRYRLPMSAEQEALFGIDKLNVPRSSIPAVTHVDYSARIQTVHRETNPRFHALISAFRDHTGVPVLVNTSFNVRGEPIVNTPADAFRCFMGTGIDWLVVGNCILRKEAQTVAATSDYRDQYELD
jgi:carbamoyltransferase